MNQMQDVVKAYYGETLTSSSDLKTDACTTESRPAAHVSAALAASSVMKHQNWGIPLRAAHHGSSPREEPLFPDHFNECPLGAPRSKSTTMPCVFLHPYISSRVKLAMRLGFHALMTC